MAVLKVCAKCGAIGCTEHVKKPWQGSTRRSRTVSGWEQQRRAKRILLRYDGICHVCGLPGADQADHVVPLSQGGEDTEENLRPIHSTPCHEAKTEREAQAGRKT